MKKIFLVFALCIASVSVLSAQSGVFVKGDKVLGLGVGLGNTYGGSGYKMSLPPIILTGEYALTDALIKSTDQGYIGVGGYLSYLQNKYTYPGTNYGWNHTHIIVGARGAFHYQFVDKLDTYVGVMLGYNIHSSSWHGASQSGIINPTSGGLAYSTFVGARYYLSDKFAVWGEVGYGYNILDLGIAIKF